jgi:hypothetical protein
MADKAEFRAEFAKTLHSIIGPLRVMFMAITEGDGHAGWAMWEASCAANEAIKSGRCGSLMESGDDSMWSMRRLIVLIDETLRKLWKIAAKIDGQTWWSVDDIVIERVQERVEPIGITYLQANGWYYDEEAHRVVNVRNGEPYAPKMFYDALQEQFLADTPAILMALVETGRLKTITK